MATPYPRSISALTDIMRDLRSYCQEHHVSGSAEYVMTFAVEEVFTNMVKYNPSGPPTIGLQTELRERQLVVRLIDDQAHEFDPLAAPDPDLQKKISDRKPGGLGIYLVKSMVQSVQYERHGTINTITLAHSADDGHVQRDH